MRDTKKYNIFNAYTPVAVTSSTDATPIVVTATSHGLTTGDSVLIFGHTTNVAANGIYRVVVVTANTYQLKDANTGANVAGSGGGAGASGLMVASPKIISVEDFTNIVLQVGTSGTATLTLKVAGALGANTFTNSNDTPNFGGTVTPANNYTFLNLIDLIDGTSIAGGTGIVATAADLSKNYEVNINASKYICVIPTSWTQGAITVKMLVADNG